MFHLQNSVDKKFERPDPVEKKGLEVLYHYSKKDAFTGTGMLLTNNIMIKVQSGFCGFLNFSPIRQKRM